MMGATHTIIAAACGLIVMRLIPEAGPAAIVAACAGGLLPDADRFGTRGSRIAIAAILAGGLALQHPEPAVSLSGATMALAALSTVLAGRLWGHRTATHSLAAVAAALSVGTALGGPGIGVALAMGWASHIAADAVTTEGVAIYWPWSSQRMALRWFPTGSPLEVLIAIAAAGAGALALMGMR
jgi:inner membrane protein